MGFAMHVPRETADNLDWSFAEGLRVAYGDNPYVDGYALILPRDRLDELVTICELPGRTWGYAAAHLSPGRLEELFEHLEYEFEDAELDVSIDEVPTRFRIPEMEFLMMEWPETPFQALASWAYQERAIRRYVTIEENLISGSLGLLETSDLPDLLADLKRAGATCRRDGRGFSRVYAALDT